MAGTYWSWSAMKSRCDKPDNPAFHNYGGRGISYDPRWAAYGNFRLDMGSRPAGTTLDRIDNDKGYFKENCRWATRSQQSQNRRQTQTSNTGIPNVYKTEDRYRAFATIEGRRVALYQGKSLEKAIQTRKDWENRQ